MKINLSNAASRQLKSKGYSALTLYGELISGGCGCGCCGTSGDFIFRLQLLVKAGKPSVSLPQQFSKAETNGLTIFYDRRLEQSPEPIEIDLEQSLFGPAVRVVRPLTLAVDNRA